MAALTHSLAPPAQRGGWWHHYVCPAHGVELEHGELLTSHYPAGGVPCRYGCRVDSADVRGAWYVLAHQAWARRIRLLAHRGERDSALGILFAYNEIYLESDSEHELAQDWMVRGRLFHQALTEAIWAVSIGHAVITLADDRVDDLAPVLPLLDALTEAAGAGRAALVADGKLSSNYVAWFNAAGAVTSRAAALVRGETWQDTWLRGECGLFAHLLAAILPDGWQWEASTYYHGFVLRAALLALRDTAPTAIPGAVARRLRAMVEVLGGIATEGGVLPALHDGPYLRPALALEWLELAALAGQFTEHAGLSAIVALARHQAGSADDELDRSLDGWFDGPPLPAKEGPREVVTAYPDAGYAVLRAPGIHALLDFGPHGGGHGHLDKLALYLYGRDTSWQPDPGQVPYGHRPLRAHYASTSAHPAFSVDGQPQHQCAGRLRTVAADRVVASADDCYPGVRARRIVLVAGEYLVDALWLAAERARSLTVQLRPDCAFELLLDGQLARSTWSGAETLYGAHVCTTEAFPLSGNGSGPADDPMRARSRVDWTAVAKEAVFCSVYRTSAPVPPIRLRSATELHVDDVTIRLDWEEQNAQ